MAAGLLILLVALVLAVSLFSPQLLKRRIARLSIAELAGVGLLVVVACAWAEYASLAAEPQAPAAANDAADDDDEKPGEPAPVDKTKVAADGSLTLPEGWPAGHPLPTVQSNCMRCHLHAGRELTLAVRDFGRSVHDLNGLTCYDCHGGNADDDAHAHEDEFGFIGTKLSAHLTKCASCHEEPAERLAAGPHHWDFSKRINTKFPMCIDCHGNHDVENPPADFSLKNVCEDCHEDLNEAQPAWAGLTGENDKLWQVMGKIRRSRLKSAEPMPPDFHDEIAAVRSDTMRMVHELAGVTPESAKSLGERTAKLRGELEAWFAKNPGETNSK